MTSYSREEMVERVQDIKNKLGREMAVSLIHGIGHANFLDEIDPQRFGAVVQHCDWLLTAFGFNPPSKDIHAWETRLAGHVTDIQQSLREMQEKMSEVSQRIAASVNRLLGDVQTVGAELRKRAEDDASLTALADKVDAATSAFEADTGISKSGSGTTGPTGGTGTTGPTGGVTGPTGQTGP